MAKIVKTLTVSWQWSGDKYSLRGFNLAVTPTAKNPKEEVVATAFVETNEIKQTYSYKMGNVTLDKDAQYRIWVQAVYENSDSDWVSTGGATVTDDGSATIITKTDREIQDIVNMASDNILTRQEKIGLRREWQEIVYEFLEIESTAISQGIPSSNTTFSNFKSKGNALGTYLNGGATWTISSSNKTSFPLWINDSNLASNTSINGNTYRETFRVYYEAKVKILEEINKYKVNNVQVGGINLLMGTKDFNVGKGSGTIHSENYKGFSVLHKDMSSATSGTSDVCVWSNAIDVKQNTEYTLSFYAKGSGSFNSYFYPNNVASGYSSEGKKTTASDGALTHTLTSNWKKYWITWKTSASTTGLKNVLPMRLLAGGVGYICGVKFEEGNKATDWSPSLEEMENAYTIVLTNEAQVIPTNSSRVPTTTATYYTDIQAYQGTVQRTDYTIGTINSANGITVSKTSSRVKFAVSTDTALTADGGNFTIPITIDGKTFNKTFSWSCSKQGNTGATGNAGQDAITIILSNENHTFPCESNGNIPTALSTTCVVTAYKGATSVTPTIGSITNPTGMTVTVNKTTLTIQANKGTSLADSGTVNIPITVDGKSFNKTFSWSKAKKGDIGNKGDGAKTADIIASSQVFKSTDGGLTFSPTTITMTPKLQNVTYSNWQYSINGGSTWNGFSNSISGWSVSNGVLTISKDSSLFTSAVTSVVFRLNTSDSSVYDTMTIVKLYDVADLEIGGRNYLQNSNFANGMDKWTIHDMSNSTGTGKSVSIVKGGSWADPNVNTLQIKGTNVTGRYGVQSSNITLVANTTYTISGYCAGHRVGKIQVNVRDKQNSDANIHTVEYNPVSGGNSLSKYYKFETTFTTTSNTLFALNLYTVNLADNGYAWFANVKLEKGNKASDWIPAPEDVDKNINDVKDSLNSFQNTVNTSFKDGIIEQAEAKAIAQHLKTLDAEKADIDKEYSTIYSNANLTGSAKTNLASAKTSFDSAHASLKSTINTVISDGKVTSSESASVTSTFNTYSTQLGVYKQRVQEALDAISSGKVDSMQVGGTNRLVGTGTSKNTNVNVPSSFVTWDVYTTPNKQTLEQLGFKAGDKVTVGLDWAISKNGSNDYVYGNFRLEFKGIKSDGTDNQYIGGIKNPAGTFSSSNTKGRVEATVALDSNTIKAHSLRIRIDNSVLNLKVSNVKLEKGNKATDWSPAPEDVKNHAEQSAQDAVNAQTQNSIFNKLTNNGQTQGIYLENSKIYINGEYIKANTLSADKVLVGDYTNYCQLTEQTPMSDKFNKYTHSDSTIWHEMKTLNRDTRISRDYSCKGGEKFRVTGYVYGKVTSMTASGGSTSKENTKFRVAIFGKKTDGSNFWLYGDSGDGASTGSIVQVNKIITLPSDAKSFYVALQIEGYAPFSGVARCRNIEVRRMNTGELIVDGSITAKSLHADVLSANSIVSTINGGSTNISGNKIRTGTIQSNNGKSTINLDNGSMNLGTTSDSSYLQWTGSALNIKANSINIGSSSVATTTDVTNGVNNIDIGGKNLAKQTKLLTDVALNGWIVTDTGNKGFKKLEIVTTNTSWQECNIPLYTEINTITKSVTISFEYQETSSGLLMFNFGSYNGNTRVYECSNVTVSSSFKVISTNGSWKTVCYTFDPTSVNNKDGITQYKIQFKKASGKTGTIYVRKPKLELGNKATDWSPAPEDVDSAINNKANSADVYKKSEVYTKTETNTEINSAKDSITQSVSKTYETKTNVTNKINNLTVSATNLLDNSAPLSTNGWSNWSSVSGLSTSMEVSTTDNSTHGKQGKITFSGSVTGHAGRHKSPVQKLTSGKTYSWSIWLRSGSGNLTVQLGQEQNGLRDVTVGTSWTRFTHTYTANDNQYYAFIIRPKNVTSSHSLYFHSVMLVEGDKPVAWQTSPTEVLSDKTSIEQRMSSAESKITAEAITNTVKKNFYTKTETENAITSKGYATQSQVQQTADNIQFKFNQTGGYNLIRNGNPKPHNYRNWWVSSNANWYLGSTDIGVQTTDTNEAYAGSATFKVQPGKTYSFNCWLMAESNTKGADVYFIGSANDDGAYTEIHHLFTSGACGWTHVKRTFTVGSNINYGFIRIDNNGRKDTSNTSFTVVFFSEVLLVQGSEYYPQWSPNPNEVYDGITTIDKDGVTVKTSSGAYTQFSSAGMYSYNNSGVQTIGIRNGGLTLHNSGEYVGYISQSKMENNPQNGISIGAANQGEYISIGFDNNATSPDKGFRNSPVITIFKDNYSNLSTGTKGVNFYDTVHMNGRNINSAHNIYANNGVLVNANGGVWFDSGTTYPSVIYENTNNGMLGVYGDNGVCLGYRNASTNMITFKILEERESESKIHMYDHVHLHGYDIKNIGTIYNPSIHMNGYARTSADYTKIFKAQNTSSSPNESYISMELGNDYVTYFNIQARHYNDGLKYIARFHYNSGSSAGAVGIHFYRALNCHGYNITNVGNMNVFALAAEDLEVNDIRIATPVAVCARDGYRSSLSIVKSVDDVTESSGTTTIRNKRVEVPLPDGLILTDYFVHVTGNKIANLAVTERNYEYFVIETDSDEEIEVFYTIKAFQPKYATRIAMYGELQGEESPEPVSYEESENMANSAPETPMIKDAADTPEETYQLTMKGSMPDEHNTGGTSENLTEH